MSVTVTTGQGVQNVHGGITYTYTVTGHCFNPPLGSYSDSGSVTSASIYLPGSSFDLTDYYPGTEVIMSFTRIDGPEAPGTGNTYWYHPAGDLFFTYTWSIGILLAGYWAYVWSYVGVRPASKGNTAEINVNGTYSIQSGVNSSQGWAYFTISNVNSSRLTLYSGSEGKIWVEGQNIRFISYMGTLHTIGNDGVNYGNAGGTTTGSIWVPNTTNTNYLCYVDDSGFIRHTKNGDGQGWQGADGVGTGGHTPGYIWAEWGFNWAALMFINYDGWQIRISQGYMFGNSY